MKLALGSAIVAGLECRCRTCEGHPFLVYTKVFEDLVLSGLEQVETYPETLARLNEFCRCRRVEDVAEVDDIDDLAKEVYFTLGAEQIDHDCIKWPAIVAYVAREAVGSFWADLLRQRLEPPQSEAPKRRPRRKVEFGDWHDDVTPLAKLFPIPRRPK